jgi:hypothetical protein
MVAWKTTKKIALLCERILHHFAECISGLTGTHACFQFGLGKFTGCSGKLESRIIPDELIW